MNIEDIDKFRVNLLERLYYLNLAVSLMPPHQGGIMDKSVREALIGLSEFVKESANEDLRLRGENVYKYLVEIYNTHRKILQPKKANYKSAGISMTYSQVIGVLIVMVLNMDG